MRIAIGTDHGGYILKEGIKEYLENNGHTCKDFGCYSKESCDYPDFGFPAAEAVAKGECERGIVICKTGIGMSITANKVKGIRAALCFSPKTAEMSRRHNNANVLVLAAEYVSSTDAQLIIDKWLDTEFEEGRHQRRISKIDIYENRINTDKK